MKMGIATDKRRMRSILLSLEKDISALVEVGSPNPEMVSWDQGRGKI